MIASLRGPRLVLMNMNDYRIAIVALGSGAIGFLTKPFNEDDLLDGLRTALTPDAGDRPKDNP